MNKIEVYLEVGKKRTFAGALDWPGWCRSGKDEESALQALLEYSSRYARVDHAGMFEFEAPDDVSSFVVVERLKGNTTTDFGAPGIAPSHDSKPASADELCTFEAILKACWKSLDACVKDAAGKTLRLGPRGGGRQLQGILEHIIGGDESYLSAAGGKVQKEKTADLEQRLKATRRAIVETMNASARGEIPARGPRGGVRWTARYFVRRVAWHTLDHVWEIEDRVE